MLHLIYWFCIEIKLRRRCCAKIAISAKRSLNDKVYYNLQNYQAKTIKSLGKLRRAITPLAHITMKVVPAIIFFNKSMSAKKRRVTQNYLFVLFLGCSQFWALNSLEIFCHWERCAFFFIDFSKLWFWWVDKNPVPQKSGGANFIVDKIHEFFWIFPTLFWQDFLKNARFAYAICQNKNNNSDWEEMTCVAHLEKADFSKIRGIRKISNK